MSSWRSAALSSMGPSRSPNRLGMGSAVAAAVHRNSRPYSREKRDIGSPIRTSGRNFLSSSSSSFGATLVGPKTTSPERNVWSNAVEVTKKKAHFRSYDSKEIAQKKKAHFRSYDSEKIARPTQTAPGRLRTIDQSPTAAKSRSFKRTEKARERSGVSATKRKKTKEVMSDDLDALLAEIDGVTKETTKPAEIHKIKVQNRAKDNRRRRVLHHKKKKKERGGKENKTCGDSFTKLAEISISGDMEKLMDSLEDYAKIGGHMADEEEDEEDDWIGDEAGMDFEGDEEDEDDYDMTQYRTQQRSSSSRYAGEDFSMEAEIDSDDDEPPEIVMIDDKVSRNEGKNNDEKRDDAHDDDEGKYDEIDDRRKLGMEASAEDFENSYPLGWDCNIVVGQMVIVERSNGNFKYGLVSNFEDDDEGLAVVEFLVDIRKNGERVIKRWDVEDRPFDVRVLRDDNEEIIPPDDGVLHVDDLDPEDEKLVKELFVAARSGAWREIQQFCNAEPDFSLDIRDKEGYTAVAVAAFYGHVDAVEIFLENGADPNLGDADSCTPLHCSAQEGFTETVNTLIRFKADVNVAMIKTGRTPLFLSCQEGYTAVVELIIAAKADPNVDNKGCTPLFISVQESHAETLTLLLKAKANVNQASRLGTPPLLMAVQKDDITCVRLLLDWGADVNASTPDGITALSKAMLLEFGMIVRLLKSRGAIMDPAHGEKTLQEVANRVSANTSSVAWNDTARTAIGRKKAITRNSAYGMLTRTKDGPPKFNS